MSGRVVALDIGGTFIKSGVFENGKLGAVMKTPTGAGSLEEIKRSVSEAVEYHLVGGAEGIAASSAGDFDPYRGVCTFATDNLKGYSGFALKAWLEEKYGVRASALNDGHAAMLGEAKSRALKEAAVMLTLGTGVGGAYFDGRKVVFGEDFRYGRFGHLVMRDNGKLCGCGQCGCIESYISATALTKLCAAAGTAPEKVFYEERRECRAVVNEWLDALCEAMETVFRAQEYDLMIFGGGVCASAERWLPLLGAKTERRAEVSKLGNSAGLTGAYLWWCENG